MTDEQREDENSVGIDYLSITNNQKNTENFFLPYTFIPLSFYILDF